MGLSIRLTIKLADQEIANAISQHHGKLVKIASRYEAHSIRIRLTLSLSDDGSTGYL